MKKYMTIGTVVGSVVTVERLIRYWGELTEGDESQDGWWWLGALVGAHAGNMLNIVLWPLAVVEEIYELAKSK